MKASRIKQQGRRFFAGVTLACFAATFIWLLGSVFWGCTEDKNPIAASSPTGSHGQALSKLAYPDFGDMRPLNKYPEQIIPYGPKPGKGWKAIWLPAIASDGNWEKQLYDSAKAAGYNPIIANIEREDIVHSRWSIVMANIEFAKENGAHWIYVDDGCSGNGVDTSLISKGKIDYLATLVHYGLWRPLATSEWDKSRMSQNPSWHDNVDIIMPYRYSYNPTQLDAWFSWVKTTYVVGKNKQLYPFLGYYAKEGGTYYTQTGVYGGGTGPYIETAQKYYSPLNLIFYYTDGDMGELISLTNYLQNNYNMGYW